MMIHFFLKKGQYFKDPAIRIHLFKGMVSVVDTAIGLGVGILSKLRSEVPDKIQSVGWGGGGEYSW